MDEENMKVRPDLKCVAIGEVWEQAQYLAKKDGRSVSGLIREVLKNMYKKEKKKEEELTTVG